LNGIIRQTDSARDDLLRIGRFVAERSGSIERALKLLEKIDSKCASYSRQPMMGDLRPDLGPDVRIFPVQNFVVVYRPISNGIEVLMVTHGARDLPKVVRDRLG